MDFTWYAKFSKLHSKFWPQNQKTKGHKETLGGDGYFYLACGDGFSGVCICSSSPNCTHEICAVLYINYTSSVMLFFLFPMGCVDFSMGMKGFMLFVLFLKDLWSKMENTANGSPFQGREIVTYKWMSWKQFHSSAGYLWGFFHSWLLWAPTGSSAAWQHIVTPTHSAIRIFFFFFRNYTQALSSWVH